MTLVFLQLEIRHLKLTMSNNFLSEDLLWKLGISTLFILSHRMFLKSKEDTTTSDKKTPHAIGKESQGTPENVKIHKNPSDLTDNETISSADLSNDLTSAAALLRSPTDTLETILHRTSVRLSHNNIYNKDDLSSSFASYSPTQEAQSLYQEIMKQSDKMNSNRPPQLENEYIETAFQQTIKLFYEENKQLKRKIDDLNQQVHEKNAFIQQLQSSASITLENLKEENEKLLKDKLLLIQSIEIAQSQFQQIIDLPPVTPIVSAMTVSLPNSGVSTPHGGENNHTNDNADFANHLLFRMEQILNEIHLSALLQEEDGQAHGSLVSSLDDDSNHSSPTKFRGGGGEASPGAGVNYRKLFHKLLIIKQIINTNYANLQSSYQQLLKDKEGLLQLNSQLKTQLSSVKLSKVQEITTLHRKYMDLQYRYEQQQQKQEYGLNQLLASPVPPLTSASYDPEHGGMSNPLRGGRYLTPNKYPSSGALISPSASSSLSNVGTQTKVKTGSRSSTPNKTTGGTGSKLTPPPSSSNQFFVTPNKQFINIPLAINHIGNSENTKIISKELTKSFRSTSPASTASLNILAAANNNSNSGGRDKNSGNTPSKLRKAHSLSTMSPSLSSPNSNNSGNPLSHKKSQILKQQQQQNRFPSPLEESVEN
jgi:cell division septum initiation protein DivIVA